MSSPQNEGQPPDPHKAKSHTKEASNPGNIYPKSCYVWVPYQLEESRNLTIIDLDWQPYTKSIGVKNLWNA